MQRKSLLTLFFLSGFSALVSLRAFYLLGHLPPLLRPDAQNSLMLSFGNGITTGALATHQIPVVEVVELAPGMVEAAQVQDNDAFFLPINAETGRLVGIIQLAAMRANP